MESFSSSASISDRRALVRRRHPPSQGWTTFLRNHADGIVAMDLFVVPTISFRLLYGLLILRHDRGWGPPRSRPPSGSPTSSLRHAAGRGLQSTSSTTGIVPMARYSPGVFGRWASEIDRPRRDRLGRMPMPNG